MDTAVQRAQINYANRDNDGRVSFYVLLWKRKGVPLSLFYDYWREVHGTICARLPGQFQYWQYHLKNNEGGYFPLIDGVDYSTGFEDQIDGIAELTFSSAGDRKIWFDAASILMDDEHNIFRKAIGYVANEGNVKTYFDSICEGDSNGDQGVVKFHLLIKKRDHVAIPSFRHYLSEIFAQNILQSNWLAKLRLSFFEEPDQTRPDAAKVSHFEPGDKQYQAACEIAFKNALEMELFFASEEYAKGIGDQAKYIKQVSAFPQKAAYALVYNGKMTLAGRWGSGRAQLISSIGAINVLKDGLYGD